MVHISLVTAGLVLVLIQLSQGRYLSYMILSQMSSYTNMFYLSVLYVKVWEKSFNASQGEICLVL